MAPPKKNVDKPAAKAEKAPPSKGISPLARAKTALKKTLETDHSVPLNEDLLSESLPHITTGSITVDYLIGGRPNKFGVAPCPGWPRGKLNNLYGNSGAGKTTMALETAAEVCKAGGTVCYIDWENEVDVRYAAALGVPIHDTDHFDLQQPETLEQGMMIMVQMAAAGVDLIVLDSVGAAVPKDLWDRDQKETGDALRPGLVAAKWSQFLPQFKKIVQQSGTCVIGISQLRKTMSSMSGGGPEAAPQGGEAWKFYSAVRMMLRVFQKEKGKRFNAITGKTEEMIAGTIVLAKLDKCKVSDSVHQEQKFYLESGTGIDNARSVIELAKSYGVILQGGAWYEWPTCPDKPLKVQGVDALKRIINENPKYLPFLFSQVAPKLGAVPGTPTPGLTEEAEEEGVPDDMAEIFSIVPGFEKKIAAATSTEDEPDFS